MDEVSGIPVAGLMGFWIVQWRVAFPNPGAQVQSHRNSYIAGPSAEAKVDCVSVSGCMEVGVCETEGGCHGGAKGQTERNLEVAPGLWAPEN